MLTYVKSNHNIRVGIDVDRQQDLDNFTAGLDRPSFNFANIVDFAVDHPSGQSGPIVDVKAGRTAQSLYSRVLMLQTAPFVQDDWKVTKNLTVNAGLRFDYFGHLGTVTYGPNPLALFTPAGGGTMEEQIANGSMLVRGSHGQVTDNALWRLAPRFGFAYDVFGDGTTSVHGGWGMFNNKIGDLSYADGLRTNPPQFANPNISIYNSGTTPGDFSYGRSSSGPTGFAPPPGIKYEVDPHGGLVGTPDRDTYARVWPASIVRSHSTAAFCLRSKERHKRHICVAIQRRYITSKLCLRMRLKMRSRMRWPGRLPISRTNATDLSLTTSRVRSRCIGIGGRSTNLPTAC